MLPKIAAEKQSAFKLNAKAVSHTGVSEDYLKLSLNSLRIGALRVKGKSVSEVQTHEQKLNEIS